MPDASLNGKIMSIQMPHTKNEIFIGVSQLL